MPLRGANIYLRCNYFIERTQPHLNMAIARPIRVLGLLAIGLWIFFLYQVFGPTKPPPPPKISMDKEPLLDRMLPIFSLAEDRMLITIKVTGEPDGAPLWRADQGYGPGAEGTNRINATLLSLVRNEEVDGMVQAMRDLERTWNSKFNYPWTFFNDVPFTEEFKRRTKAETKAECKYGECCRDSPRDGDIDSAHRIDSKGTLGSPLVDRRRAIPRISQDPQRKRHPIRRHEILPPDVQMEQRALLQTSCSSRDAILLASGA